MATDSRTASAPSHGYWQAQGLVELELSHFESADKAGDTAGKRSAFYRVARSHGRTLHILNSALEAAKGELAESALHNLTALHIGLTRMHRLDPEGVPMALPVPAAEREAFLRDLIMRVLSESRELLSVEQIDDRVIHLDSLGQVPRRQVLHQLGRLVHAAYVVRKEGKYMRSDRPYAELDWDSLVLRAITGEAIYEAFEAAGFSGLSDIDDRPDAFARVFEAATRLGVPSLACMFVDLVRLMLATTSSEAAHLHFNDILNSPYPRPYQRAALQALRRSGYKGTVIEAPTGSGKTMIGMLCIQDWLRAMPANQSILIVVPTANYLQQWTAELCAEQMGLHLSPEVVFAGTPMQLYRHVARTGERPAIVLTTYTALSQFASPIGKGGFDAQSIEMFLQGANVKHIVLDEVHKVLEDQNSLTFQVARLFMDWLRDDALRGLIGFSGTVSSYRRRIEALDMHFDYTVPMEELVAAGFVAPYTQFGLPFSYSGRETRIRTLLDRYKDLLHRYFEVLGPARLRRLFAGIAPQERVYLGHEVLGMYRGRKDWQDAIAARFAQWETGSAQSIGLSEVRMVTILQVALGLDDAALVAHLGVDRATFAALQRDLDAIRQDLQALIYLPATLNRLQAKGFGEVLDAESVRRLPEGTPLRLRGERVKDLIASSFAGLYDGLSDWYLRVGEGRVACIRAIVEAESRVRPVSGKIVFDTGRRIRWREGLATPGYQGVGGLFAELLGDPRHTVFAVLSNEMYLPHDAADPLSERVAQFIEDRFMLKEAGDAIFGLVTQGLQLEPQKASELRGAFEQHLRAYLPLIRNLRSARTGELDRAVFKPVRRVLRGLRLRRDVRQRIQSRLDRRNVNLRTLERTFFDYALLAKAFRQARLAELQQVNGARRLFHVVPMPTSSHRKQLMYDLTSRIVDADDLPIDFVIVSNWARTGWNVIKPNLLIDATATRDVTAWRQLIGRSIRARRSWTNDCYRLLVALTGHHPLADPAEPDTAQAAADGRLDDRLRALLADLPSVDPASPVAGGDISGLSAGQRLQLAQELVRQRNKVTHIFELVKAYGSDSQVTRDRNAEAWLRRDGIAAKHETGVCANPLTGRMASGVEQAPLLYHLDPRLDAPEDLGALLEGILPAVDDRVIQAWMS